MAESDAKIFMYARRIPLHHDRKSLTAKGILRRDSRIFRRVSRIFRRATKPLFPSTLIPMFENPLLISASSNYLYLFHFINNPDGNANLQKCFNKQKRFKYYFLSISFISLILPSNLIFVL